MNDMLEVRPSDLTYFIGTAWLSPPNVVDLPTTVALGLHVGAAGASTTQHLQGFLFQTRVSLTRQGYMPIHKPE